MNQLESQLLYPFGDQLPERGSVVEVAPDVFWLRMPLPFALDHINLWLLRDGDGWTAIDTGVDRPEVRAAWEQVLADVVLAGGSSLKRVLVTHCHPDHVGLAHWLCARFQVPLVMTTGEYAFARMMAAALPGVDGPSAVPHFERHGLYDPVLLEQMRGRRNYYPSLVPAVPEAYTRLQDGQEIRIGAHGWRVITGFGHSPEHAALYCVDLNLLVSGDMVLPRISTNVSVFAVEPEADPVRWYLQSLDRFAALPDDVLVLPAHGRPFRGLHTRIAQLRAHHAARLEEVLAACSTPRTAAEIVPVMFRRPLDSHQLSFALGEALAHLNCLFFDAKLQRMTGPDGVVRFAAS
ncbi:MBL fold metallo-hydrolase [Massilia arenosa]|uniref:MBL fold metallo-hydrolase n=1 Tax=Zemynaea arenosa TaxID=2561931 RepID=A0A4Y9RRC0_9BURK|nr:MBL fold metallo-hydrolase [Massilia arenosa]TFW10821.1 MBL fold metallo-hydrolase [Massilia arenosa]